MKYILQTENTVLKIITAKNIRDAAEMCFLRPNRIDPSIVRYHPYEDRAMFDLNQNTYVLYNKEKHILDDNKYIA